MLWVADEPGQFLWGLASLPVWVVLFKAYGLYDRDMKRINQTSLDDLPWTFHAVLLGCALLFALYHFAPPPNVDVAVLALFGVIAIATVTALRAVARRLGVRVLGRERVVLLGNDAQIGVLAQKLRAHREYGVEPVGLVSGAGSRIAGVDLPLLGDLDSFDLERAMREHRVERIVVAHEEFGEGAMLELLRTSPASRREGERRTAALRCAWTVAGGRQRRGAHDPRRQPAGAAALLALSEALDGRCGLGALAPGHRAAVRADRAGDQARLARSDLLSPAAGRLRGPLLSAREVPHHGSRRGGSSAQPCWRRARIPAGCTSKTIPASPASGAGCVTGASTSCRSSGTC